MYKTLFMVIMVLFSLEACQYYSQSQKKLMQFPKMSYSKTMPKAKVVIDMSSGNDSTNNASFYNIDTNTAPFTILIREPSSKQDSLVNLVGKLVKIMEDNSQQVTLNPPPDTEGDLRFLIYLLGIGLTVISRFITPETLAKLGTLKVNAARILLLIRDSYLNYKTRKNNNNNEI